MEHQKNEFEGGIDLGKTMVGILEYARKLSGDDENKFVREVLARLEADGYSGGANAHIVSAIKEGNVKELVETAQADGWL